MMRLFILPLLFLALLPATAEGFVLRSPSPPALSSRASSPSTPPSPVVLDAAATAAASFGGNEPPPSILAAPFCDIVRNRYSNTHYAQKPVSRTILNDLLRLTQRAPSSFNTQPFKLIVLQDPALRDKVATHAMLGANGDRVRNAPVTVIFAADLEKEAAQEGKEGHAVSSKQAPASLRFDMDEVVCEETYGVPWKGGA
eukprot:evm.model.NODE_21585_length_24503_cov_28.097294.11